MDALAFNHYNLNEMNSNMVFIDVDTQFDFMDPAGALYVPGAEQILGTLGALFEFAKAQQVPVLSSVDEHAPDDPEFRDWPPHCVRGTPGQAKVAPTLLPRAINLQPDQPAPATPEQLLARYEQLIFPKPTLDAFDNPHFERVAAALAGREFFVFGVATDYCVNLAARGLLQRGRRVKIVEDAVRGIDPRREAEIRAELTRMGAGWVRAESIIGAAAIQ